MSVGYRNPPVHTRWQKGQSGNSRGRPPLYNLLVWAIRNQHHLDHLSRTKQGRRRLEQLHRAHLRHYLNTPESVIFAQQLAGTVDEIVWERVAVILSNPELASLLLAKPPHIE